MPKIKPAKKVKSNRKPKNGNKYTISAITLATENGILEFTGKDKYSCCLDAISPYALKEITKIIRKELKGE